MKRCVIVAGAQIRNYPFVKERLRPDDFYIFCDSGLSHMSALGVAPNLIAGDFDSHENPNMPVETIILPREKDDTDSVYAVKEGIARGFDSFLLVGVVGGRLDHTIANVSILVMLHEQGKCGRIIDDYSVMEIVGSEPVFVADDCKFFSLLNITGMAEEINVSNAKYPLENGTIKCSYQYGTSNEVLPGKIARIVAGKGVLLLIRVFCDSRI